MNNTEIAQILNDVDMYELACKTNSNMKLDETEAAAVAELDAHFKEIGKNGYDKDHEIAQFVSRVVNEEIYNAPDELLDSMFDRGNIGEFDDYQSIILPPKNTLIAYEAAKGGNVDRSFLDVSVLTPTWKNRQVETDIKFAEVRRGGWKTISTLTEYAVEALRNAMFADVFNAIDQAITSGADNYIAETYTAPTQASMDALALYLMDEADGGPASIISLSKYIQTVSKFTSFISDDIVNEVHRTGRLGVYDSVSLYPISSAKKLGNGDLLIPDKRMFGVAGKIGTLDMKGSVNVYQDEDNNKELFRIKVADFTYGYAFNQDTLKKVAKMVLA